MKASVEGKVSIAVHEFHSAVYLGIIVKSSCSLYCIFQVIYYVLTSDLIEILALITFTSVSSRLNFFFYSSYDGLLSLQSNAVPQSPGI